MYIDSNLRYIRDKKMCLVDILPPQRNKVGLAQVPQRINIVKLPIQVKPGRLVELTLLSLGDNDMKNNNPHPN